MNLMLLEKLKNYNVILASQSPRRKSLLEGLGLKFEVKPVPSGEEAFPQNLDKFQIPVYLSEYKSFLYGELEYNDLLITADTIVWMNERVINKPDDYWDAIRILRDISGNMHEVITGVTIRNDKKTHSFFSHTEVFFSELSDQEIEFYVMNYKPYDKAGAYGVQEWIGHIGIEKLNGSYFNVMGLPVQKLYRELENFLKTLEHEQPV
jgi:septum formation protein